MKGAPDRKYAERSSYFASFLSLSTAKSATARRIGAITVVYIAKRSYADNAQTKFSIFVTNVLVAAHEPEDNSNRVEFFFFGVLRPLDYK